MDNDTIKDLGLCPICQKGHIMKGSLGYSCNYFKNMNDKCTFNIYHSYWGKEITEEIARQLITTGKTDIFHDFHNKKGVPFSAYLTIENGIVIPSFVNEVLETPCPVCGREIEILLNGYACKGYSQKDKDNNRVCNLYIPKTIAQREIPLEAAEILARGKKTPFMTGFKSREGNDFSSRLVLTENLDISFDNTNIVPLINFNNSCSLIYLLKMNTKIANVIKRKFFINQYRNLGFNIISSEAMFVPSFIT